MIAIWLSKTTNSSSPYPLVVSPNHVHTFHSFPKGHMWQSQGSYSPNPFSYFLGLIAGLDFSASLMAKHVS